jgi:hypothetical protein
MSLADDYWGCRVNDFCSEQDMTRIQAFVIRCVPEFNPFPWIVINALCCAWSVWLIYALHDTDTPRERILGTHLYLIWNFVTTIMWCVEVGLIVSYSSPSWVRKVELVLAFYFMIEALQVAKDWKEPDNQIWLEYFDLSLNSLAYLFELYMSMKHLYRQCTALSVEPESDDFVAMEEQANTTNDSFLPEVMLV